jgi:hypothetical protein
MRAIVLAVCSTMLLLAPVMALAAEPAVTFVTTVKKTEDRVAVTTAEDRTTLTVTSPSGIGSATIAPKDAKWPKTIVLRLRLSGLESLNIANEKTTLTAEVSSHGDGRVLMRVQEGGKEQTVEKGKPYWTEIKIIDSQGKPTQQVPVKDGYFELTLPAELLQGQTKSLTIKWIDFYR